MTSTEIQTVTHDAELVAPVGQPPATLMQKGVEKLRQHAELKAMAMEYAEFITKTGGCPDIYRGKPMEATAAIIRGTALGFDPDGALEAFFVIHGKTGMYARAMVAVAENVGCRLWEVEATDESVTWEGVRPGDDKVERVTWSMDRAKKAGYASSNKKYGTNSIEMLRAKCQAELSRMIAPGALMGLVSEVEKDEVQRTVRATAERTDRPQQGRSALDRAKKKPAPEPVKVDPQLKATEGLQAAGSGEELDKILNWAANQGLTTAQLDSLQDVAAHRADELGLTPQDGE